MAQHGMEQDFQRMTIHETRKQLSPTIGRQQTSAYRPGPAPFRGYQEEFPPPPPMSAYMEHHNFPPPPPEPKENIYHEIQDNDILPPPPAGAPGDHRGVESMYMRSPGGYGQYGGGAANISSYESSHESQTLVQPSGRYVEREVKQATYSVQSSDSCAQPPYSSQYANLSTLQGAYNTNPMPQTYGTPGSYGYPTYGTSATYTGQYSASNFRTASPVRYSATSPRQPDDTGVTYAHITPKSDSGVTYAQIAPRSDRPVPGPQVPIQVTVADSQAPKQTSQYLRSIPIQQQHKSSYSSSQPGEPARGSSNKEQEVDALTQMLMQGLEGTKDPEFFGICSKCGKKVIGDTNGCTAMDQIFHISCFCCHSCGTLLRGKSFYALERKPHCESCYVNTLERCSICSKPITDRLLRATGKPYHPACFTCVVCGKSLDGVPFTVDATNQIHCIEDFHRKFAPRCCVCHKAIMPEKGLEETVRVVAMDRSFHVDCYRCEDCGELLSSEAEGRGCYPLDEHILCKTCNAKRINAITTKLSTEL